MRFEGGVARITQTAPMARNPRAPLLGVLQNRVQYPLKPRSKGRIVEKASNLVSYLWGFGNMQAPIRHAADVMALQNLPSDQLIPSCLSAGVPLDNPCILVCVFNRGESEGTDNLRKISRNALFALFSVMTDLDT
jgi:hypothetical protein